MYLFLSLDNITAHFCFTIKNDVIFYSHQNSFCSFAFLFKRIKFINPIQVNVTDNTPNNYIEKQQTKGFKLFFSRHYTFKAIIKNFLVVG